MPGQLKILVFRHESETKVFDFIQLSKTEEHPRPFDMGAPPSHRHRLACATEGKSHDYPAVIG